jgi:5-methylcytosine-specific restriction endonuclease McrA
MRFEIILILITAFIVANIYTDGKYFKMALSWKKYYKMAGVIFAAFVIYILIKKNPLHAKNILMTSNEYLKYMPIDKNTSRYISPILDFTTKQTFANDQYGDYNHPFLQMPPHQNHQQSRVMNSGASNATGGKTTKRSVSETKKKFVAARQNWRCGKCTKQLPAWFEVDHKTRLEHGGSNHVDNLEALCRDCHGEKTAIENL